MDEEGTSPPVSAKFECQRGCCRKKGARTIFEVGCNSNLCILPNREKLELWKKKRKESLGRTLIITNPSVAGNIEHSVLRLEQGSAAPGYPPDGEKDLKMAIPECRPHGSPPPAVRGWRPSGLGPVRGRALAELTSPFGVECRPVSIP